MEPPQRIGSQSKPIVLTGTLFPWDGEAPCFLGMPGSEYEYLPCFTSADKLHDMMAVVGITDYTIKQVEDGPTFLTSFDVPEAKHIRVIVDPHFVEGGRLRFFQVAPSAS